MDRAAGMKPAIVMYAVSNRLNGLSTSRADVVVQSGKAYTAALTLNEGYWLISIKVTMGGEDVTATAWNEKKMTVSIPDVTGNIVITAEAKLPMLKEMAVGAVIKLVEKDGATAEEFVVIAQDYEKELNGEGRTLLARRHGITGKKWNTTWCTYADSLIDVYLNSEYLKDAPQAAERHSDGDEILLHARLLRKRQQLYRKPHGDHAEPEGLFALMCYEFGFESYGYTSGQQPEILPPGRHDLCRCKEACSGAAGGGCRNGGERTEHLFPFLPLDPDAGTERLRQRPDRKCAERVSVQVR